MPPRLIRPLALFALALCWAAPARAQNTWVNPNTGVWGDAANWVEGVPTSGATTQLIFNGTGTTSYTATNDLAGTFSLNSLTLNNTGTGTISIGGNGLLLTGTSPQVLNNGSGNASIANAITLGADATFGGTGTGTVAFSGTVLGGVGGPAFGLNMAGAGTYAFSGTGNNLAFLRLARGTTNITAGTWNLNLAGSGVTAQLLVGNTASQTATLNISSGTTFTTTSQILVGAVANSTGVLNLSGSGTVLNNTATGFFALVGEAGNGTMNITNGAVFNTIALRAGNQVGSTGVITVNGANSRLQLTTANQMQVGLNGTGTLNVQNGGTYTAVATTNIARNGGSQGTVNVDGAGSTLSVTGAGNLLSVGTLGTGIVNVTNGGTVTAPIVLLTQSATGVATVTVNGGTLNATTEIDVGTFGNGTLNVQTGGLVTTLNAFIAPSVGSTGTATINGGTITGAGQLQIGGAGTTPGGTGTLNVASGGSATFTGLAALFATGTVNVNAGSLSVGGLTDGTATSFGNVVLSNNASLTVSDGIGLTYTGVISGSGSFTKAGTAVQTLAGANTYTGPTAINAGTLTLAATGSVAGSSTITVASGATFNVAAVAGGFGLGTGQTLRGAGAVTGAVAANTGSTVQGGAGGAVTATNTLSLGSTLTTDGAVTLRTVVADTALGNAAADPTASLIAVTGAFDRNTGGTADALTVRLVGSEATLDFGLTYTVTVATFASTNLVVGDFSVVAEGFTFLAAPTVTLPGGSQLQVTFVPTPEPATVFGVLAGLTAGGGWLARRRRVG